MPMSMDMDMDMDMDMGNWVLRWQEPATMARTGDLAA